MAPPVTRKRIETAQDYGIENAHPAAVACREAGVPFFVTCALLEQESPRKGGRVRGGGANIYGHDKGGVHSIDGDMNVSPENFLRFLVRVMNGATSNGVGPLQITYAGERSSGHRNGGYFRQMAEQGLLPWDPHDNILFGLRIFKGLFDDEGSWEKAYAVWNGGSKPNALAKANARKFAVKVTAWQKRLEI